MAQTTRSDAPLVWIDCEVCYIIVLTVMHVPITLCVYAGDLNLIGVSRLLA
jgi:hypothetical protein